MSDSAHSNSPAAPANMGARSLGLVTALSASLALIALGLHALHYMPFIADDALISLRYSERLLEGRGLTFNDGDRVEGYTNLLWVLACALLRLLGVEWIATLRVLGLLCSGAACIALVSAYRRRSFDASRLPELAAPLVLALAGPIAVWSIGGLEAILQGALMAWAISLGGTEREPAPLHPLRPTRRELLLGVLLGSVTWTRADGFVLVGAYLLGLTWARGLRGLERQTVGRRPAVCRDPQATGVPNGEHDSAPLEAVVPLTSVGEQQPSAGLLGELIGALGSILRIALVPLAFVLAQFAFRRLYYDDWLPNTAYAKVAFNFARLKGGWDYVSTGLGTQWAAFVMAAPALALVRATSAAGRRARISLVVLVTWCAYLVVIGGDIFPAHRHLVVELVALAFLVGAGLESLTARGAPWRTTAWAACSVLLTVFGVHQLRAPDNRNANIERWELDGEPVGRLLQRHFGAHAPLYAVDAAGCLPFWSKLPTLDMLGLNDRYLAHNPPKNLGHGALGHELGDANYYWQREPDLVHFGVPADHGEPKFTAGRDFARHPRFRREYTKIAFELAGERPATARIWVRKQSPRLGFRQSARELYVPGFSLANAEDIPAREGLSGQLGAVIGAGKEARLRLNLPGPGRWVIHPAFSGAPPVIRAWSGAASTLGYGGAALDARARSLEISVAPHGSGLTHVYSLHLSRK